MPKRNLEHVVYGLRRFLTGRVNEKAELPRFSKDHAIRSSLVVRRDGNRGSVEYFSETLASRRASLSGKVFHLDVHKFDEKRVAADQSLRRALAIVAQNYRTDLQYFKSLGCTMPSVDIFDSGKPLSTLELYQEIYPVFFPAAPP